MATSWFSKLDLSDASTTQRRILRRVTDLLVALQPARLRAEQQSAELAHDGVTFTLRHDYEPWLEIEAAIGEDDAQFYGVMGHDETYSLNVPGQGETDAIEVLAELLEASYTRETFTLRGKPWRTVTHIGPPSCATVTRSDAGLLGHLPLGHWARPRDHRRANFECTSSSASE